MADNRNILGEIDEVKERRKGSKSFLELSRRLSQISRAFKTHDQSNDELTRYFPVALIATIEAYFRQSLAELIDIGEPYLSNANKLSAILKFDFALVRAVNGRTVTIGELIGHSIKLSRLDSLEAAVSMVIGRSFKTELTQVADRWEYEVLGGVKAPILSNPEKVLSGVARMFELRNIICHETATGFTVSYGEVASCFTACQSFLRASDVFFQELRSPGAPLTQTGMNIEAGDKLAALEHQLSQLVEDIRTNSEPEQLAVFDDAQKKWEAFRDAWLQHLVGEREGGGSIWPMEYALTSCQLTTKRIEQLLNPEYLCGET